MQKLILCGKLFDGVVEDLQEKKEILVENGRIAAVGENLPHEPEAEILDLRHLTVTPGLIDAHVHSDLFDWKELVREVMCASDAFFTLSHLHTAQRELERGFTTLRCHAMLARDFGLVDVRNMIDRGVFTGSRLNVTCHMLGTVGSHCDNGQFFASNPRYADLLEGPNVGSGADFFKNAVRREVKYGSDFVKLFLSGGFGTPNDGPEDQQMDDEEITAFLNTANALRVPSTAHVYAPKLMQKLIKNHISCCEHGALMDEETAEMFEKTGTYLVPTFCPYDDIIFGDENSLSQKSPEFRQKLRYYGERLKVGREIIKNSNIRLGYGTDLVAVNACYESWREYESWLNSGMNPFRALKAATIVNAEIIRMQDKIGSIEPGKYADISAWHRDLLTDPLALSQCDFAMKEGVVHPTRYARTDL